MDTAIMAKKSKRKQAQKARQDAAAAQPEVKRRDMLKLLRNGAIGAVAVGVGGYFTLRSVRALAHEYDLSRVGQGKPSVVQVHNPQCPTCNALQRETRQAMEQFGECDLVYLVADITTPDGGAFANFHRVPHVTLLLFDGEGQLQQTLQGMRDREELEPILVGHFERFAKS